MRKLLFTIALLMMASPSFAAALWADPPKRFDHPYAGTVRIYQNLTPFAVGAFWPTYGFTFVIPGTTTCIIQVWKPYDGPSLRHHEMAHCNGWPANHPK